MEILTIAVSATSGLVLGVATVAHFASRTQAALRSRLEDESLALDQVRSKLREQAIANKPLPRETKGKGRGKNRRAARDTRRLEKQASDAVRELERLRDAQMATEKTHSDALGKLQRQLAASQEETRKAQETPVPTPEKIERTANPELAAALKQSGNSLDAILTALIEHEAQEGAVLGDVNGIVIAQSGDAETLENTAAASNTLLSLPRKLEGILAMNKEFGYRLHDGENSIAGRTFELEGDLIALTTVGKQPPEKLSMEAVVESISAALA